LPVSPDWSPVGRFGGYAKERASGREKPDLVHTCAKHSPDVDIGLWDLGCDCFAF